MRKKILAAFSAVMFMMGILLVTSPTAQAENTLSIKPGQVAFMGSDGSIRIGHPKAVTESARRSVFGERTTQACDASRSFLGDDGSLHYITGNVVVRVAWTHDTRGADRDVSWIDWDYNWPGTGSGQGTGISFENNTNFILSVESIEYRNAISGLIASYTGEIGAIRVATVHTGDREHIWGHSDGASFGNLDGHSYWDNAPRIRVYFTSATYDYFANHLDNCDAYVPGQPYT